MRALVMGDSEEIARRARQVLVHHGVDCPSAQLVSLAGAETAIDQRRPNFVVMALRPDSERTLAVLRGLRKATQAHLIIVGPADDPKLILRVLREGADEYFDEAELESDLSAAILRFLSARTGGSEPGRILAVLAPSGGSGSSTLAVNIATILAKQYQRTALFDLKLGAGDLPALLNLKPQYTLADLCKNQQRLDRSMFEQLLVQHASGVCLLAAPDKLADSVHVTAQGVRQALVIASSMFPYVVADVDHSFREEQVQVLRQADVVLVVLRLEVTSVRNTGHTLGHLNEAGIEENRLRLVVNRYGQSKELATSVAEQALGMKIHYYVPDDPKNILRANNKGIPAVLERPWAGVSRRIRDLAMSLNGKQQ